MEQINEKIVSTSVTQGAEMSLHRLIPNIEFAPSLHGVVYMGKGSCTVDGITYIQSTYLITVQFSVCVGACVCVCVHVWAK